MNNAAQTYVAHGWPVFPLKPKGKEPLTQHGYKDATIDGHLVENWLKRWPNANVGLPTGRKSGIIVLDVDPRNGGDESLAALEAQHGPLPRTVEARTGSGGRHLLFRHPGGEVRCSAGQLGPGLDIKGDGGYVVISPSVHPNGNRYEWIHPPFNSMPLADPPAWLLVKPADDNERRAEPLPEVIPSGERNNVLTSLAGTLRRRGLEPRVIEATLLSVNQAQCSPPLPDEEVRRIAASVGRYEPGNNAHAFVAPTTYAYTEGVGATNSDPRDYFIAADHLASTTGESSVEWFPLLGQIGFVGRGLFTLLSARPKAGKTTLTAHCVKIWLAEGLLIAWLTEEPKPLWRQRIERMGLSHPNLLFAFPDSANAEMWAERLRAIHADIIIVDTARTFLGINDENDPVLVHRALAPIVQLARQQDAALLVLHHRRKADGDEGTDHSGSHAYVGDADIAVTLKEDTDRRRVLATRSRFEETPDRLLIELGQDYIYKALGRPDDVALEDVKRRAKEVLTTDWQTTPQIIEAFDDPKPGREGVRRALHELTREGTVEREQGAGRNPDKWRFVAPTTHVYTYPVGATNEEPDVCCSHAQSVEIPRGSNKTESCAFSGCDAEVWRFTPGGVGLCEQHYVECDEQAGGSQ